MTFSDIAHDKIMKVIPIQKATTKDMPTAYAHLFLFKLISRVTFLQYVKPFISSFLEEK